MHQGGTGSIPAELAVHIGVHTARPEARRDVVDIATGRSRRDPGLRQGFVHREALLIGQVGTKTLKGLVDGALRYVAAAPGFCSTAEAMVNPV